MATASSSASVTMGHAAPSSSEPTDLTHDPPTPMEQNDEIGGTTQSAATLTQSQGTTPSGKKKPVRPPSEAWTHFTKIGRDKAKCNYCGAQYACDSKKNGTSNLKSHIAYKCKKYPGRETNQKSLSFEKVKGEGGKLSTTTFSAEACRRALARMIVKDELPFSHVEGEGFRDYSYVLESRFTVPSRITVARDVLSMYLEEMNVLKTFLISSGQRVCLTTDTWTSVQNLNYMCLTAHFIDSEWKYHKKILNFCQVLSHKGEMIGKAVESCLLRWGIDKVFTITVDNASSNDLAVAHLSKTVNNWKGSIMGGLFMHMRCCAHILNLVVTAGLKEYGPSIDKIRNMVRYVRASPARLHKFKKCVEREKITAKKNLCLDVTTRWNSTYLMLESAVPFQRAFKRLEQQDKTFARECSEGEKKGVPTDEDWEVARAFIKFLKVFYDATLKFSGSLHVTSDSFIWQLCMIHTQIRMWSENKDPFLRAVANNMREKYNKYWDYGKINPILFIATLLDPRQKETGLRYRLELLSFSDEQICALTSKVMKTLEELYDEYKLLYLGANEGVSETVHQVENRNDDKEVDIESLLAAGFEKRVKESDSVEYKTEIDKYLMEGCESRSESQFDILAWWKINSAKFRVLSCIARDVLAVPVSTVASESAFSTGGRILDPFRSSLSPRTVEALICTQNWVRVGSGIDLRASMDEIEELESGVLGNVDDLEFDDDL